MCLKVYGIRSIDDIFGGSKSLDKISLPTNEFQMDEFLLEESFIVLLRYREYLVDFAKKIIEQRAMARTTTPTDSPRLQPKTAYLFAPTKRRGSEAVTNSLVISISFKITFSTYIIASDCNW
ncbi:hypothetical protein BGX27_007869 [Mortierella sp. AM989]|nr:hypothetical protein BGX27_007869 [Mortierella sp. AM989]